MQNSVSLDWFLAVPPTPRPVEPPFFLGGNIKTGSIGALIEPLICERLFIKQSIWKYNPERTSLVFSFTFSPYPAAMQLDKTLS